MSSADNMVDLDQYLVEIDDMDAAVTTAATFEILTGLLGFVSVS